MRIAVVGCSHGSLDDIYASVERCDAEAHARGEDGVDLMICCGDFQAMRCPSDLHAMACPPKYRALGHFSQYYSEQKRAPFLTLVIGGNHESSGYMWECFHGGWLAPDIYFLGFAGCVLVDGWLRIAGASGIWKAPDFRKGHFETVPFDDHTIRSVYHIREYEVARLLQLESHGPRVDVFLSHDWPLGIEQHGDVSALIRDKPFFKDEIISNSLGSPPLHHLLTRLQPSHWFSAHLHVKFAALVHHSGRQTMVTGRRGHALSASALPPSSTGIDNPDEIALDEDDDDEQEGEEGLGQASTQSEKTGCAGGCADGSLQSGLPVTENPDEISLDDEGDVSMEDEKECHDLADAERSDLGAVRSPAVPCADRTASAPGTRTTKFLALSKPGTRSGFLHIVDIPAPTTFAESSTPTMSTELGRESTDDPKKISSATRIRPTLYYDPQWLSIVRAFSPYLSLQRQATPLPPESQMRELVQQSHTWIKENVGKGGKIKVEDVQKFARTAPGQGEPQWDDPMPTWYTNPQTEAFCAMIGVENRVNPIPEGFQAAQEQMRADALRRAKEEALQAVDEAGDVVDEEPVDATDAS